MLGSTAGELAANEQEAVVTLVIEAHNYGLQQLTVGNSNTPWTYPHFVLFVYSMI